MRQTVDGGLLAQMMIHAAASINLQKQQINELNVFPVPDGDTGTNMSLTIGAAAAELKKGKNNTVGEVSAVCASALLRGARGNSGVILSLLFRGFAKSLKNNEEMNGGDFAIALDFGVATAYKAVMKPAEGTILTVSRLCARRAAESARENPALEYVLEESLKEGHLALANTVEQNPVLKKAGVVDAGGMGFLVILQGMLDEIRGVPIPEEEGGTSETKEKANFADFSDEDITFSYCTEFICSKNGRKKDTEALRAFLNALGDSLVVVDDDEIIKVHVHTDHPGRVLEEAIHYGALLTVKIENMREQHTEILEVAAKEEEKGRHIAPPEKKLGFVAVCAGSGLEAVFRDLGADGIISGGQTMNPSTEDILREIDRTPASVVFVLPNNKNIIMAAQQCVPLSEEKRVIVLPTATVPQGISAMLALDPDASEEENAEAMTNAIGNVKTAEITYAARDSEFDGFEIHQGDYLALVEHQLFGTDRNLEILLDRLAHDDSMQSAEFITVFYGKDVTEEQAQKAQACFAEACPGAEVTLLFGGQPVYYYMVSAE